MNEDNKGNKDTEISYSEYLLNDTELQEFIFNGLTGNGINLYRYCSNNPLIYTDPTGKVPVLLPLLGFAFGQSLPDPDRPYTEAIDSGVKWGMIFTGAGLLYDAGKSTINSAMVPKRATTIQNEGASMTQAPQKVIGHYPEYVEMSKKLRVKPFSIPDEIWGKMTKTEQWAANQKFLDRAIAKGTEFILATQVDKVRPGSFLEKEINYLLSQGYKHTFTDAGTKLVK